MQLKFFGPPTRVITNRIISVKGEVLQGLGENKELPSLKFS